MFGRATITLGIGPHSSYTSVKTVMITARSEMRKVLFLAPSVCAFLWPPCVADADIIFLPCYLWSPYGIGRPYIFSCCGLFMVALCNGADHIYFHAVVCSSFFFFFYFLA